MIGRRTIIAFLAMSVVLPLFASGAHAADISPRPTIVAPIQTNGWQGRALRADLSAIIAANRTSLPQNSGSGRRVVYDMNTMHVWLVEADESVVRDYAVSGSTSLALPRAGTYHVFSKSAFTTAYVGSMTMQYMVRFSRGSRGGNIGFHAIPRVKGQPVQSEAQLGTPLSGGCVRQADVDALFLWDWAPVGTTVVVLH